MKNSKKIISPERNPLEISEEDAKRLRNMPTGSIADIRIGASDGDRKTVSCLLRRAKDSEKACSRCALQVDLLKEETLCPYWRTCFASSRPDNDSVYFEEYSLKERFA